MPAKQELEVEGGELTVRYVLLSQAKKWERNPKLHDLPALEESFREHGFRDPPGFDGELQDGGGIVEGNGRVTALANMLERGEDAPLHVGVHKKTGEWAVPMLFGADSKSRAAAVRYAIDHNNLTMKGGAFDTADLVRMWNPTELRKVVEDEAGALPSSLDGADIQEALGRKLKVREVEGPPMPGGGGLEMLKRGSHIRPVVAVHKIEIVERAFRATGSDSRGEALVAICEHYLKTAKAKR